MKCFEITSRGIGVKTIREKGLFTALSRGPAAVPPRVLDYFSPFRSILRDCFIK